MLLALTFIQVAGSASAQFLGVKTGAILSGFFGGLISSTATTASLARKSKLSPSKRSSAELLTFLSATAAMLFEGASFLLVGADLHYSLLLLFAGPILMTGVLIFIQSRKLTGVSLELEQEPFKVAPILKLSGFIITILAISKFLQNIFGQSGLMILTFLVSLFEIHGSIIANVQLHDDGMLSVASLGNLLAISITASYLSKIFLISTFGSPEFRTQALKSTLLIFASLLLAKFLVSK
jgi:uncharacterized membrane protein (DUF4010 family)